MVFDLQIDSDSDLPAYRQLMEAAVEAIRSERLAPGTKLPGERALATQDGLARGTVRRAVGMLAKSNILVIIPGRGRCVSFRQASANAGRKEKAVGMIDRLLGRLERLNFTHREIATLIDLKIMERQMMMETFAMAVVDCNPEALGVLAGQLAHLSRLNVTRILLDDLYAAPDAKTMLEPFALIVTTANHFSEVLGMAGPLAERILPAVVSPASESIVDLAKIRPNQRLGLVCRSKNFAKIVQNRLKEFQISAAKMVKHVAEQLDIETLQTLLAKLDVLIVAPDYPLISDRHVAGVVQDFVARGGRILTYNFQIERGSLLQIEERIKSLLHQ